MASELNPNSTLSIFGWNIMQDGRSASSTVDIPAFLWSVADFVSAYLQLPILNIPYINLTVDGHVLLETVLLVTIIALMSQKSYKPENKNKLTEKEIDQLCDEWQPEPLHPPVAPELASRHVPVLESAAEPWVVADGKKMLNLASMNFLGLVGHPSLNGAAAEAIQKYGVGSCGPRGFYGTIDVHVDLEERLARFMGTDDCILYSYGLATAASTIPAFCKNGDLIVADEGVSWAIQNGITLSRSTVRYYRHNDMEHLEEILKKENAAHAASKKPLNRRFIIAEAIYQSSGQIAPLPEIVALKEKYKFRVLLDESLSFGVLGEGGKGATQHFNLPVSSVDIIVSAMGTSLASAGGFCCGSTKVVDHQRLGGLGYCFSASLPPYLASTAMAAVKEIEEGPERRTKLADNIRMFQEGMAKSVPHLSLLSSASSPLQLLRWSPAGQQRLREKGGREGEKAEMAALQRVVDEMREKERVLISLPLRSPLDGCRLPEGIRICLSSGHEPSDIKQAVAALKKSTERVVSSP